MQKPITVNPRSKTKKDDHTDAVHEAVVQKETSIEDSIVIARQESPDERIQRPGLIHLSRKKMRKEGKELTFEKQPLFTFPYVDLEVPGNVNAAGHPCVQERWRVFTNLVLHETALPKNTIDEDENDAMQRSRSNVGTKSPVNVNNQISSFQLQRKNSVILPDEDLDVVEGSRNLLTVLKKRNVLELQQEAQMQAFTFGMKLQKNGLPDPKDMQKLADRFPQYVKCHPELGLQPRKRDDLQPQNSKQFAQGNIQLRQALKYNQPTRMMSQQNPSCLKKQNVKKLNTLGIGASIDAKKMKTKNSLISAYSVFQKGGDNQKNPSFSNTMASDVPQKLLNAIQEIDQTTAGGGISLTQQARKRCFSAKKPLKSQIYNLNNMNFAPSKISKVSQTQMEYHQQHNHFIASVSDIDLDFQRRYFHYVSHFANLWGLPLKLTPYQKSSKAPAGQRQDDFESRKKLNADANQSEIPLDLLCAFFESEKAAAEHMQSLNQKYQQQLTQSSQPVLSADQFLHGELSRTFTKKSGSKLTTNQRNTPGQLTDLLEEKTNNEHRRNSSSVSNSVKTSTAKQSVQKSHQSSPLNQSQKSIQKSITLSPTNLDLKTSQDFPTHNNEEKDQARKYSMPEDDQEYESDLDRQEQTTSVNHQERKLESKEQPRSQQQSVVQITSQSRVNFEELEQHDSAHMEIQSRPQSATVRLLQNKQHALQNAAREIRPEFQIQQDVALQQTSNTFAASDIQMAKYQPHLTQQFYSAPQSNLDDTHIQEVDDFEKRRTWQTPQNQNFQQTQQVAPCMLKNVRSLRVQQKSTNQIEKPVKLKRVYKCVDNNMKKFFAQQKAMLQQSSTTTTASSTNYTLNYNCNHLPIQAVDLNLAASHQQFKIQNGTLVGTRPIRGNSERNSHVDIRPQHLQHRTHSGFGPSKGNCNNSIKHKRRRSMADKDFNSTAQAQEAALASI